MGEFSAQDIHPDANDRSALPHLTLTTQDEGVRGPRKFML